MEHALLFIILGACGAFFMAFNNGSNDVANAFGSAIGSKALKMKTAVFIASIVTFSGAMLLGGRVATKLISGLVPPSTFNDPREYMIAMITVMLASGIFVLISTLTALPVSSSQAIVGGLTGISIMLGGWESVNWDEIVWILSGWVISPLLAGVLAFSLCKLIEGIIIGKRPGAMERVKRWLPVIVTTTICGGVFALFTITSLKSSIGIDAGKSFFGLSRMQHENRLISDLDSLQYAVFKIKHAAENAKIEAREHKDLKKSAEEINKLADSIGKYSEQFYYKAAEREPALLYAERWQVFIFVLLLYFPLYIQVRKLIHRWLKHLDEHLGIQQAFRNLQVGTSCYVAFAIGSNDVANSISPLLAIVIVARAGGIPETFGGGMPFWILVLGGFGMAAGISLLGYKVMRTLGEGLTEINNSRGFCIDFSVATSVVGASACGIPVSTTHAATGAVVGSGLSKGWKSVKFGMLGKIAVGWLVTIPFSCIMTIVLFKLFSLIL
jgi:phosphate/sulfate permease